MSTIFSKKAIKQPERVGTKLRQLREHQRLTLDDVALRTKLQKDHLIAIESCAFHKLPHGEVYQRFFLKRYLSALQVDPTPFLKQFEYEEQHTYKTTTPTNTGHPSLDAVRNVPALIKTGIIGFGMLLIISYLGLQFRQLLLPPTLVLESPTDGIIHESTTVTVTGTTDPEVTVSINGEAVYSNAQGNFSADIDLQPGLNTILVTAEKKHGKQTMITRHIIYRESTASNPTSKITQLTPIE
jgi:cytoskeletal protein RodZ